MDGIVVCMCEGNAEKAIMEILLNEDKLIFNREQLLDEQIFSRIPPARLFNSVLTHAYGDNEIHIIRIIDSIKENFPMKASQRKRISTEQAYLTRPEIEMLIIISKNHYEKWKRSRYAKPSAYCKEILGITNIKTREFVLNYFSDVDLLIHSIKEYDRIHSYEKNEHSLFHLLKT